MCTTCMSSRSATDVARACAALDVVLRTVLLLDADADEDEEEEDDAKILENQAPSCAFELDDGGDDDDISGLRA